MNDQRGRCGRCRWWAVALLAPVLLGPVGVRGEVAALTPEELARCAQRVQTLRGEAPRLVQLNARHAQTRDVINARTAALQAERKALDADDLAGGLDFRQRMEQHTRETLAFNAEIERLKRDVVAIDALKSDYDRDCAQRPYRRADLQGLPESAREAMRAGLAGIRVPYLDQAVPSAAAEP